MSPQIIRIAGGRVLDPSQEFDAVADVWVKGDQLLGINENPGVEADQVINAEGLLVMPGLVDMHAHLRDPGDESDETIETATRAALEGGITSLACMADTEPALDNQAAAEFVYLQARRAGNCHVWPVGALTKRRVGEELAEMGGLVEGGAVAFSDSPEPVGSADIMRRALEYSQMFDRPVLAQPEVPELTREGLMNEGVLSANLGLPGLPAAAEEIMVARDLQLVEWVGGRLHLQTLSCKGSVTRVRYAKSRGYQVTAEVTPHHFSLTEQALADFDCSAKVKPPLRTNADVDALIAGLADGTIDAIASGHSPWAPEKKLREIMVAPFGISGLETLLPLSIKALVEPGHLSLLELVRRLSTNPARILGIPRGTLMPGMIADITLVDPRAEWTIDPEQFLSNGKNSPFAGYCVTGRTEMVLVAGDVKFQRSPTDALAATP